jgi:hypothetical protein
MNLSQKRRHVLMQIQALHRDTPLGSDMLEPQIDAILRTLIVHTLHEQSPAHRLAQLNSTIAAIQEGWVRYATERGSRWEDYDAMILDAEYDPQATIEMRDSTNSLGKWHLPICYVIGDESAMQKSLRDWRRLRQLQEEDDNVG